jgi:hypothetical protein
MNLWKNIWGVSCGPVGPQKKNWINFRRKDAASRLSKTDNIQRLEFRCRALFFPWKQCRNGVNGNESGKIQQRNCLRGNNCTRLTRPLWNQLFLLTHCQWSQVRYAVGFSWTISLPHLEERTVRSINVLPYCVSVGEFRSNLQLQSITIACAMQLIIVLIQSQLTHLTHCAHGWFYWFMGMAWVWVW